MSASFKYCDQHSQATNAVASLCQAHIFALNGLYDPDITSTGHQPLYYDQVMGTVYSKYRVDKCHVRMAFAAPTVAGLRVGYRLRNNSTGGITGLNLGHVIELPTTKWTICPVQENHAEFNFTVDIAEVFGVSRAKYISEEEYSGSTSANPTSLIYLELWVCDTTAAGNTVLTTTELRFDAQCFERQTVSQS